MTQDEIIKMATQAGMLYMDYIRVDSMKQLEAFAKLVAERERKRIKEEHQRCYVARGGA